MNCRKTVVLFVFLLMLAKVSQANTPPFLSAPLPDTSMSQGSTLSIDLTQHFTEITNEPLGYFVNVNTTKVTGEANTDHKLNLIADASWLGVARVIVTAMDTEMETASDTFTVTVKKGAGIAREKGSVQILQNPGSLRLALGALLVRLNETSRPGMLRLVDAFGRTVVYDRVTGPASIVPIPALSAGVYCAVLSINGRNHLFRFGVPR